MVLSARDLPPPPGWEGAAYRLVARAGSHESAGAFALACATAVLAGGEADEVLVLGGGPDRGYAFILAAPGGVSRT